MIPLLWACVGEAPPPEQGVERYEIATADGAGLVLHRHQNPGPSVLLVHGLSSNHWTWEIDEVRNLGHYLSNAGLDTWLLDLRGHGESRRAADGKPQRSGWVVDDYGRYDLPAAVDLVLAESGRDQVGYVGHSMGGMVAAIYAGTVAGGDEKLSSLVVVGSPIDFTDPDPLLDLGLHAAQFYGPFVGSLPTQAGARLQASLGGTPIPVDALLYNDLSEPYVELMYERVVSPISGGELRQFGALAGEGGPFVSRNGDYDYRASLARIRSPTLVVAGRADNVAPVDRVVPWFHEVGADEKRLIVAGRAAGFAADYGHMDLCFGDHVVDEIYPLIRDWVDR